MLDIPYEQHPGNACALACYTMVARYFFPESTFEKIAKISNWSPGYIVWGFRFWQWIMVRGIKVEVFDVIDLRGWAEKGAAGLQASCSPQEYEFYFNKTKDIEKTAQDIKLVLGQENFTYHQRRPQMSDLLAAVESGAVCEVVLNSVALDKAEGYGLHRVVVLGIDKEGVVFHDPRKDRYLPKRRETLQHFEHAWLATVDGPELCVYRK